MSDFDVKEKRFEEDIEDYLTPVSYTHLDVYKRQIYCLGSDGSKGEYASKEMIQAHEGLFGMESQMWERIRDQDLDYSDEDCGAFQEPISVIDQEEALKLYDAGADIYLITNFSSPVYVTERNTLTP